MAKPDRQPAKGVSLFIDGIIAKRIQSVDVGIDVTREQTVELANAGVVENVRDNDSVTIDIEANNVGSTDLLALLTDRMIEPLTTDVHDGPRNRGYDHKWFIQAASSNASTTWRTITEQELLDGYCSILVAKNENSTAAYRTSFSPRCALTNVSLSFDVNGNATESYSLLSDRKTWFINSARGIRAFKPVHNQIRVGTTTGSDSTIAFVGLGSCVPLNATPLAVLLNDQFVWRGKTENGGTWQIDPFKVDTGNALIRTLTVRHVSGSNGLPFATPFVATAAGTGSDTSERALILYYGVDPIWESAIDKGYELESTTGALGAIRKGQVKATLFNTDAPLVDSTAKASKALRLQTVSIDINLGEERLYELGRLGHYAVSKQTPVPVNITVTANDTDAEYFALLTGTTKATLTTGPVMLNSDDFTGNNRLQVDIYKENDQTTLLETITITGMEVVNEGDSDTVGGESTQEISFLADNIHIVGKNQNVTGGWDYNV